MKRATVRRERTAIRRGQVSRPVRLALERDLITRESTVLDYGCGRGEDVELLRAAGYQCFGWDPVLRPDGPLEKADVVNLSYVVNVIENPSEREQALHSAWDHATKVLVVAARLTVEAAGQNHLAPYGDGFLTSRGTFQKFFDQSELREWIDEVLGVRSVAAAPGVFLVFRSEEQREGYLAMRYRRTVAVPGERASDRLFEQHRELLEPFMRFLAERGRLPKGRELPEAPQVQAAFGSLPRAFGVVRRVTGSELWDSIRDDRTQDLLVYLALERFAGRPRFAALPSDIQGDVRAFFGSYKKACKRADELLFSAGDRVRVEGAVREAQVGKVTRDALYVHLSGLANLPAVLRVLEGCARNYIGEVEGANLVKLHRQSPRVSYLSYPGFDEEPHPKLLGSLLVDLRNLDLEYRDYSSRDNAFILHRKECFVPVGYPGREKFARLTRQEERRGLFEDPKAIGTENQWSALLRSKGLRQRGHQIVRS